jgi:hypothetical protein
MLETWQEKSLHLIALIAAQPFRRTACPVFIADPLLRYGYARPVLEMKIR